MLVVSWLSSYLPGYGPNPPTWRWALLPLALLPYFVFTLGCVFAFARWVAFAPDLRHIISLVNRFILFGSGIMFSIPHRFADMGLPDWVIAIFTYQPWALYIEMVRSCVMTEASIPINQLHWLLGADWAVLVFGLGFIFFWRAEHRYGRV
jgi:teichoic acid transport system permease protein